MKILHIFDHSIPLHSGYTFRSRAILQYQAEQGWETAHVTSPKHVMAAGEWIENEEVDGLLFYRSPLPQGPFAKVPMFGQLAVIRTLAKRIDEVIEIEKPDILHAHSPALNGQAALACARRHRLPLVYEIRAFWEDAAVDHGTSSEWGGRYRMTRALETRVVKKADAVTTICQGLRSDLIRRGIAEDKITVIPNAVDITKFSLGGEAVPELVKSLGLDGKTVLGFIGSFYAYEGLELLLQALPKLLEKMPDIRALLVGGGPEEETLKALAERLNIADKVVFTGRVPHAEVNRYYDLVSCLVYPRISMRLTDLVTPLKPLEAMAQGRLVLASDVGGHKELINPGITGELFRAGDVDDLVNTAYELLHNPERWPLLKQAGREYVERERNWSVSVANYKPVYERLYAAGRR